MQNPLAHAAAPLTIELGRRVHFAGCGFGDDCDGVIVAINGVPGAHLDRVVGPMTMVNPNACTFDVITFDGRSWPQCRESSIGRRGIGAITLLDRVHGPAMIERAHRLVAEKKAADALAATIARENFERQEAAREILAPPVFYWNGIKDAKGAKLQRAHYSDSAKSGRPEGTITVYARDYDRFSAQVRACFAIKNDTDSMTDYFDRDSFDVIPAHPLYALVRAACDAQNARHAKRYGGAA